MIPITLDYPSALNMTITPSSADFMVSPYIIDIRVGDILKYF